tara:strand:- start:23777 stop:25183 length:1407 start_codon:yes stop_codon:yes gene_type:complete
MKDIKFGTDGWRAIIAKDFTTDNVARVSYAVSEYLIEKFDKPSIVIGYDCRFGGYLFTESAIKVFVSMGIKVIRSNGFVSTPMVSLGVVNHNADLGIVITASHNPPSYNGYKLKANFGGPLLPNEIHDVELRIPQHNTIDLDKIDLDNKQFESLITHVDLETEYCEHANCSFDIETIRKSGLKIAYDSMFGAGRNVIRNLLPEAIQIHDDNNPSFNGISPEPIYKNLLELSEYIKSNNIDIGLATDGDADRIGLINGKGEFIDSHHIILLLIHYLVKYRGWKGKVVVAFSCSVKIKKMCDFYNLDLEIVKIGFKHIAGKMMSEDILLGGEESGGIATKGHLPERDGIWMGLILFEFLAKSGKSIDELINEVYNIVGTFSFERLDLNIDEELKKLIILNCENNKYNSFGNYKVQSSEDLDGFKYFFDEDSWVMIRPSGTEPVLRIYAESYNKDKCLDILESTKKVLINN